MYLSVVIPVYNAGQYLQKCVDSVLSAGVPEMEVIIVDDGSTDGSVEKLSIKAAEGIEIKIFRQKNGGVSAARNIGLGMAQGKWIWFVDADDEIEVNPGYVYAGKKEEDNSMLKLLPFIWEENGHIDKYEAKDGEIPYNLWRCWFRKAEIDRQKLSFTIGRKYAEDQEFILKYLINGNCETSATNHLVYHYTVRFGSAMTKSGTKRKQMKDLAAVLCGFTMRAMCKGQILKPWVKHQIRRMTKCLMVTFSNSKL